MQKKCFNHNIKYLSKYIIIYSRFFRENKFFYVNNKYNLNFCQFIIKELKVQGEHGSITIKQCIHCKIFTLPNGKGVYICPGIPLQVYDCNLCNYKNIIILYVLIKLGITI